MATKSDRSKPLHNTDIHEALSNDRRCRVLEKMFESNPRNLRSLADEIAAAESGTSPAPRDVRQSVYVTLHQNHLPKLDSLDILEYDEASKDVVLGERADEIDVYFEVVEKNHLSRDEFYFGLALVGLLGAAASTINAPVVELFGPIVYATAALLLLLLSTAHRIYNRGVPFPFRQGDRLFPTRD